PPGGAHGGVRGDPRRHRVPENAARAGPPHRGAEPGHRAAASRAAPPAEEPAAGGKSPARLALVLAGAAFGFEGGEVDPAELPPQARETLELMASGGPFPHVQDGRIFHNRERRLPLRRRGYYREYTVKTPGAPDRGARRIVAGEGG